MKISEGDLIERIRKGDVKLLEELYAYYKPAFTTWAIHNYGITKEDTEDIWQDVVIIFFENVKKNKLEVLKVKLITYLYAIGKHLIYKKLTKLVPTREITAKQIYSEATFEYIGEDEEVQEVDILKTEVFSMLGKSCQEMLLFRYYYGMSIEDITKQTGLSSKNTVSASISRCLKHLKSLIFNYGVK
ncbi:MAG: sigma-70 family RNA polymerase sigma factor [Saprospiraceae bacterium]|nr:sigma-70 family RNA polymerase sigma factor [Saprospiraceae bacterium]MBK8854606.1 sigma-70 family RNA polymerase sigma factor [Saprospiraceae bacterium]